MSSVVKNNVEKFNTAWEGFKGGVGNQKLILVDLFKPTIQNTAAMIAF